MDPVAARAVGRHAGTEPAGQAVVALLITAHATGRQAELLGQPDPLVAMRARESAEDLARVGAGFDAVNTVTVGAARRLRVPPGDRLAVDALSEFGRDPPVTLAAGLGEVEFEDRRPGVRGRHDVVAPVAVGTDRRARVAAGDGAGVRALLVGQEGPLAYPARLHHRRVRVTPAASSGDVGPVDRRTRVARRQDRVHPALHRVAIDAGRRLPPTLEGAGVMTLLISLVILRVEKSPPQIRQSLAGPVTLIALKRRPRQMAGHPIRHIPTGRRLSRRGRGTQLNPGLALSPRGGGT